MSTADEENLGGRAMENLKGFVPLYVTTQVVGVLAVALILYWVLAFAGGFSLAQPGTEFNWHPFLMSLGMIYLMGNALLTFRIIRNMHKNQLKIVHASLNGVSFVMIFLASVAVFDFHNKMNFANLYSVHSWVGLMAIILFVLQGVLGFSAFLYPGFQNSIKAMMLPYHVYFGQVILVLAIAAAVSGINEKAIFALGDRYGTLPPAAVTLNVASILFVIFGILVVYLTSNIYYKRYPRPGDNILVTKTSTS